MFTPASTHLHTHEHEHEHATVHVYIVSGAFGSLANITSSVGRGLSVLALEDEEKRRAKQLKAQAQQPTDTVSGIKQGLASVADGIQEGITGVVLQPFQGAREDGLTGFLTGAVKGVAGLAVKPVSGIIEGTSKTFEGVSQSALHFASDIKPNTRVRQPRRVLSGATQRLLLIVEEDRVGAAFHIRDIEEEEAERRNERERQEKAGSLGGKVSKILRI